MEKDHVLIKGDSCWADEFNCECFWVTTKAEWDKYCEALKKAFENEPGTVEMCFGTNEYLEVEDFNDWERNLDEVAITKEEAEFLVKSFGHDYSKIGSFTWGTGSRIFDILEQFDTDYYDTEEED